MMKKIPILLILLFTAMFGHAQLTGWVPYKSKNVNIGLAADSLMYMPVKDTTHTPQRIGALTMRPQDSSVYVAVSKVAARKWIKVSTELTAGSPNSNIGSGYRLAVPGTNNIKTLFGGYGILWDSTSNTNGLTAKADTATLFSAVRGTIQSGAVDSVKVISDSVLVQYYGATPDTIATFQRYTITSPQHGQILKYDSTTKSWKNYDFTGGSSVTDSVRVYSGQFPATGNIGLDTAINRIRYRRISGGDTIIYTLAIQDSTIYSPSSLTSITFPTNTDGTLQNSGGNITTSSTNSAYGHTGLSASTLTGDGWIQMQWNTGDENGIFGFNTANAETGFGGMEAAMYMSSGGTVYKVDNGSAGTTGASISSGNLIRVNRVGSTLTLDKSTNNGGSWTTIFTYTFSSSATLYIVCDIYGTSTSIIRQAKAQL